MIASKQIYRLLFCMVILCYGILFWAANKGLEITDEAFYGIGYFYSLPSKLFPSFYFNVYETFFGWMNLKFDGYRMLRVILTVLACSVLFIGLRRKLMQYQNNAVVNNEFLGLLIFGTGLTTYAWGPLSLSYNSLAFVLVSCIVGLLCFNENQVNILLKWICSFIIGGLLLLLFCVKFSTALLLILLLIGYNLLQKGLKGYEIDKAAWNLLGILMFLFFVFGNYSAFQMEFQRLMDSAQDKINSDNSLLLIYYNDVVNLFKGIWLPVMLITFLRTLGYFKKQMNNYIQWIALLVIVIWIVLCHYWQGGTPYKYRHFQFFSIVFTYLAIHINWIKMNRNFILTVLLFLSLPFLGSAGTNNGLSAHIMFFMPFFGVAFYMLIKSLPHLKVSIAVTFLLVVVSCSQAVTGTIFYPYRDSESLLDKEYKLENGSMYHGQLLGENMWQLYQELREFDGVGPKLMFTYSHQTGLAPLLKKQPLSADWFNESLKDRICAILKKHDRINEDNIMFILPKVRSNDEDLNICMQQIGVSFPGKFRMVKEVSYYQWDKKSTIVLQVYLPQN